MSTLPEDALYMQRALDLAARGLGRTAPNPAVGAVVVRDGRVVGEGWHHAAGAPHAEVEALCAAGEQARDGTLYVTLEPCSHQGRTPPCTEALIRAGLARVVWACGDCDARCAGRAAELLRAAGLQVASGVLSEEARRLNEAYFKHHSTGLPFITLKLALTLDGRCATRSGDSRWITSEPARERVHRLRDRAEAVMVGGGTVRADDPQLTVRLPDREDDRQPLRVVVSARGLAADRRLLREAGRTLLAAGEAWGREQGGAWRAALPAEVAERVILLPLGPGPGGLDLAGLLAELGRRQVMGVLLEGGPTLAGSFLQQDLVDKLILFYAPRLLLDEQARGPAAAGRGVDCVSEALGYRLEQVEPVGPDWQVTLYPCSRD